MLVISEVERAVVNFRNENVIPDFLVAQLYGVETREINQAVKNNPDKFPEGYIFILSKEEKTELIKIFDNPSVKFSPKGVKAFTEKGLYMLATILKGPVATQTTLAIVETFAKFRELTRVVRNMAETTDKVQEKSLIEKSGEILADLLDDNMNVTDAETTIELNLAVLKVKHTVKRKKN